MHDYNKRLEEETQKFAKQNNLSHETVDAFVSWVVWVGRQQMKEEILNHIKSEIDP